MRMRHRNFRKKVKTNVKMQFLFVIFLELSNNSYKRESSTFDHFYFTKSLIPNNSFILLSILFGVMLSIITIIILSDLAL